MTSPVGTTNKLVEHIWLYELLNIAEAADDYNRWDILSSCAKAMSSQTLIIQRPARGGADCDRTGRSHVLVEMLTGDTAGLKVAIPMSPIIIDNCQGLSTVVCSAGQFGASV